MRVTIVTSSSITLASRKPSVREDLKTERVNRFLTLAYNEVRRQRTTIYEHSFLRQPSARQLRPLPCTQPSCDTSTSDGMQPADYTMGVHKEIFRPMQLFEAGIVATDNSHNHCTYSRTSFWNYNKASDLSNYFNYSVTKDCYCLSTINNKLEPRSVNFTL